MLCLFHHHSWCKQEELTNTGKWIYLKTCYVCIAVKCVLSKCCDRLHVFRIMNRNDFSNLGLKHTIMAMTMIMIIIVQKKTTLIRTNDVYYIYMGNILTCFSQNGPSSGNAYSKIYYEELLHFKLFKFK